MKKKKIARATAKPEREQESPHTPHLGHHYGPCPTSEEMGLFKRVPEKVEGEPYDEDD